ncbi:IucA/IucC family C-terminal-domain containing protein [Staphylococcus aureus]
MHCYRIHFGKQFEPEMDLLTNSAMIVREGIPNYHADKDHMASLFETMPDSPMSKLSQVIEQSGLAPEAWLECYLNRTLLPILKLFSNTGISLEAHVQNTLIELKNGIPNPRFVKILKAFVYLERLLLKNNLCQMLWQHQARLYMHMMKHGIVLKYYVVVNHLGHLVSTIGKATRNEVVLWQLVAYCLMTWKKECGEK